MQYERGGALPILLTYEHHSPYHRAHNHCDELREGQVGPGDDCGRGGGGNGGAGGWTDREYEGQGEYEEQKEIE